MTTQDNSTLERWGIKTETDNGYVVSTIERTPALRAIDDFIAGITQLLAGDIGRADLAAEGDYETMVFDREGWERGELSELDFARRDTQDEAEATHAEMVSKWEAMPSGMARDTAEPPVDTG
jgi:hypothetical protein